MWEKVKISSISTQIRGVSYSPKDVVEDSTRNGIKLLRANNITLDGIGDFSDYITINSTKVSNQQMLKVGDILLCASSGSKHLVGKAIGFDSKDSFTFGAFCKVIRPKLSVNHRYLHYYFQSPEYRKVISELSAGANINNIRNEHIDNLEIPLPPILIQEKIAEILDKADELRRKDKDLQVKYDELAQAIFIDMFGDPVRNEKGWEVKNLEGFIESIVDVGSNGANDWVSKNIQMKDEPDYAIMIRTTNLANNDFANNLKYVAIETYELFKKTKVFGGEIIMNKIGSAGDFWPMPNLNRPVSLGLNQLMIKISNLNQFFLLNQMSIKSYKKLIKSKTQGAITKSITKSAVKALEIIVPPIHLQEDFTKKIELINQLKAQTNAEKSEELFQSLLQKAFKGELVK